jgi:hypothetical protein
MNNVQLHHIDTKLNMFCTVWWKMTFQKAALLPFSGKESSYSGGPFRQNYSQSPSDRALPNGSTTVSAFPAWRWKQSWLPKLHASSKIRTWTKSQKKKKHYVCESHTIVRALHSSTFHIRIFLHWRLWSETIQYFIKRFLCYYITDHS